MGVQAFFVISGFVIPYSMMAAGYSLPLFWRFLLRRMARIEPPYLVSIAFSMALGYGAYLTPNHQQRDPGYSIAQVMAHIGYVNLFLGYPQINRVYWTLGVEFQFYMLASLLYRRLMRGGRFTLFAMLIGCVVADYWITRQGVYYDGAVVHWGALFLMGISVAMYRHGLLTAKMHVFTGYAAPGGSQLRSWVSQPRP